jgi:hypothetical protein
MRVDVAKRASCCVDPIQHRVGAALPIARYLAMQYIKERLLNSGALVKYESRDQLAAHHRKDFERWGAFIRERGKSAE